MISFVFLYVVAPKPSSLMFICLYFTSGVRLTYSMLMGALNIFYKGKQLLDQIRNALGKLVHVTNWWIIYNLQSMVTFIGSPLFHFVNTF